MRRHIITGAPGSGKTTILQELKTQGYAVIAEAATDVIAAEQNQGHDEPWNDTGFVDKILTVQRLRQEAPDRPGTTVQLYDRSPICTLALARYLGHPVTDLLAAEVDRVTRDRIYDRRVFFVRLIGFITATNARRITLAQAAAFERLHEQVYRSYGYEIVDVPQGDTYERAATMDQHLRAWSADEDDAAVRPRPEVR